MDSAIVRGITNVPLAESALGAPAAGFGEHEEYPTIPEKLSILLQRVASNHALPDGNKRTALLCAILFSNLNGLAWEPPPGDHPDGAETAEVVEAAAQEELDVENAEAGRYPLGPKEYWRGRMVGKYTYGSDGHLMTNEDFEADWAD